jgi:hypothetical protein
LGNGAPGAIFGSNLRLEIGASHVGASGATLPTYVPPLAGGAISVSLLNAPQISSGFVCGGPVFNCATSGTLASDFSAWQVNGKVASDYHWLGALTVTPSLAVFGGRTRNNQTIAQTFSQFIIASGVPVATGSYNATTAFAWNDVGVRFGLDADFALSPFVSVGIGGNLGLASRSVLFNGADVAASSPFGFVFTGASALSTNASVGAFLANAEACVTITPASNVSIRAFAGLNYDNSIPGLIGPGFTGSITTPQMLGTISPSISFTDLASYYAGGGVSIRF